MGFSVRRIVLISLNLMSTLLTLFTGLRENPLVVYATGKYDRVRARLRDGAISYDIINRDLVRANMLVDLAVVGDSYRFFTAPARRFDNVGEDRSTCMRVNSINGSILNIYYDDFWGKAPRRTQVNLYSISPPNCQVANFKPSWVADKCIKNATDPSACHRYILDNFEALRKNRLIQTGVEGDYGKIGVPFMRCQGRPEAEFKYKTDMMVHQNYWAGGNNFIMFHSSDCIAVPLVRDAEWEWGLFKVTPVDDKAIVLGAIDNEGYVTMFVNVFYAVISIALIVRGIFAAVTQTREVLYVPHKQRFLGSMKNLKYIAPLMPVLTAIATEDTAVLQFKGSVLMGSDVWMNHWLYILVSIIDSVVNVRLTYIVFQTGTWMLSKQVNFENFIFLCSALTKMTWLMCLIHTLIRWLLKLVAYGMRSLKIVRPWVRDKLDWYADASALFLSYKIYSLLMFTLLYSFVLFSGNATLMVREEPAKRGVYGGDPHIAQFWNSELTCDFFVVLAIMTAAGYIGGSLILLTRYKHVPMNSVLRLLQKRYFFVGWDSMIAMEALGIDPTKPDSVVDDVAITNCSVGSLLRQMYVSGPSGLVSLSGDYIFVDGGFSKDPVEFHFSIKKALAMGLYSSSKTSSSSKYAVSNANDDRRLLTKFKLEFAGSSASQKNVQKESKSLFERQLRLFTSGRFGRLLLVDESEPGRVAKTSDGAMNEYVVRDALSYMNILDIKSLMGNGEKKLHIR